MDRLKETLKKSKPVGKVSPELKTQRRFCEKNRARTGFWNFCLTFAFLSGLIFSKDALAGLYDDLGLESSATPAEINKAWKLWRGSFHSDRHVRGDKFSQKEADKIFVFINEEELTLEEIEAEDDPALEPYKIKKIAFHILRDPDLRKQYDEWLNSPGYKGDLRWQSQETAGKGNSGQDQASGGRRTDYERGNQTSGAFRQRRTGQQSADKAGLLHEAIRSAEEGYTTNPYDREETALQLVQTVLERDTDINAVDHSGKTALYLAAERAYFRTVQVLLLAGADPNIPDYLGRLPVHAVVSSTISEERVYKTFNQIYYARIVEDRGLDLDKRNEAIKNWLVSYEISVEEILLLLVRFKADLSKKTHAGETVIETAMKQKRWEIAHWLLDQGAHYLNNEDRESLSRIALQNNQKGLLRRIRNSSITSPAGGASTRGIGKSRPLMSSTKIGMTGLGIIVALAGLGAWWGYSSVPEDSHPFLGATVMGLVGVIPAIPFFMAESGVRKKECHEVLKKYPYIKFNTVD